MMKIDSFRYTLRGILLASLAGVALASCSDDDDVVSALVEIPGLTPTVSTQTYNTLSFDWPAMAGATQYGYTLTDDDSAETVETGVTQVRSLTFTDLLPDTPYTLTVVAYGAPGADCGTASLTARTSPIYQLAKPDLTGVQQGHRLLLSWDPVDRADYYWCSYVVDGQPVEWSTYDTAFTVTGLQPGDYTFAVTAITQDPACSNSPAAQVTVNRHRDITATVTGQWKTTLFTRSNKWSCDMECYDDGSYIVRKYFNAEGNDLEFAIGDDSSIEIINADSESDRVYTMQTGISTRPVIYYYTGYDADSNTWLSSFTGDTTGGSLKMKSQLKGSKTMGVDTFTW